MKEVGFVVPKTFKINIRIKKIERRICNEIWNVKKERKRVENGKRVVKSSRFRSTSKLQACLQRFVVT